MINIPDFSVLIFIVVNHVKLGKLAVKKKRTAMEVFNFFLFSFRYNIHINNMLR